jgi:hypothetical protein
MAERPGRDDRGRAFRRGRHAEFPGQHVRRAERQHAEQRRAAREAGGDFRDGAVAAGRDHHRHAARGGVARQRLGIAGAARLRQVRAQPARQERGQRARQATAAPGTGGGVEDDQHQRRVARRHDDSRTRG